MNGIKTYKDKEPKEEKSADNVWQHGIRSSTSESGTEKRGLATNGVHSVRTQDHENTLFVGFVVQMSSDFRI